MTRKISLCTVCRDRLGHLQQTLRHNLDVLKAFNCFEMVLLDYNSSEPLADWIFANFQAEISSGLLVFFRTDRPKYFTFPHSKNVAHLLASGDYVSNLDADNYISSAYLHFLELAVEETRGEAAVMFHGPGIGSRIGMSKRKFLSLGGYNELLHLGWGYDDTELIGRIRMSETPIVSSFNTELLGYAEQHSDTLRAANMESTLSFEETAKRNLEITKQSLLSGSFVANIDRPWGVEYVTRNHDANVRLVDAASCRMQSAFTDIQTK